MHCMFVPITKDWQTPCSVHSRAKQTWHIVLPSPVFPGCTFYPVTNLSEDCQLTVFPLSCTHPGPCPVHTGQVWPAVTKKDIVFESSVTTSWDPQLLQMGKCWIINTKVANLQGTISAKSCSALGRDVTLHLQRTPLVLTSLGRQRWDL